MVAKAPHGKCDSCPLIENIFVPSEVHESKILALAEAPGFHESQEGRPLVGVAGQDVNRIIESVGAKREHFIFVNVVSCRPTKLEDGKLKNRTPTDEEIKFCNERLIFEIEKYNPSIIIAMGKIPYVALGRPVTSNFRMSDVVGTEFLYRGKYRTIITYHPAAISHSGGVGTERGRLTRDNIKRAFALALEAKPVDRQLELL